MKHTYAELLHAIADGKEIQCLNEKTSSWETVSTNTALIVAAYGDLHSTKLRVKPPTVLINGIEVPEPLRELPEDMLGKDVYYPSFGPGATELESLIVHRTTVGNILSEKLLPLGLLHTSYSAALIHAKALLSFTSGING